MLEKLLELLLSAKSGAVAAVFLIGTTGALITATVQNGVTTITVTPNVSASPTATASPTETATASPTATATASPSESPSSSPSSSAAANCSDAAHEMSGAIQEVNRAYSQYHSALERSRERAGTGTLRTDLVNADNLLKLIRNEANTKIHSLFTCAKSEDEDTKDSENEDNDEDQATSSASPSASPSASASASASPTSSASPLVTGNDPKSVADSAVAAMKLVFDTVSAELQSAAPAPTHRPESTNGGFGHDKHDGGDD